MRGLWGLGVLGYLLKGSSKGVGLGSRGWRIKGSLKGFVKRVREKGFGVGTSLL